MARRLAVLSARLEPKYIDALTKVAKVQGLSRSQLLREFAANAESLYEFLQAERRRQQTDKLVLNGNLSQWVLEHVPPGVESEMLDFIGNVMKHAAEMRRGQETESERSEEQSNAQHD